MKEYNDHLVPEHEYWHSAQLLAQRFIQRRDLFAKQVADGRYLSLKETLHDRHLVAHLKGEITLGAYILDEESRACYTVLDADDDASLHCLFTLADTLRERGIPSYMESSRRGGHLWFFHEEAVPGKVAKRFGDAVLQAANIEDVEVFPKQEELTTGPGSLIRLPFGRHQKSGKIYPFVDPDGLLLAPTIREQIAILARADEVSKTQAIDYAETIQDGPEPISPSITELPVWEKIKRLAPAMEFISQYVDLEPTASGGVGHCPFHDDRHKSFGVNEEGNFWNCFAGCGGGSVIDFYMKWHNIEFAEAVHDLADMLGVQETSGPHIFDGRRDSPRFESPGARESQVYEDQADSRS